MAPAGQNRSGGERETKDAKSNQRQASRKRDNSRHPHNNREHPSTDVPKRLSSKKEAMPLTTSGGESRGRHPVRRSSRGRTASAQRGDRGDDGGDIEGNPPRRSSSAHSKDKDRSQSRTRSIFRRNRERDDSRNRLGMTREKGITDSIVYAKISSSMTTSKKVQVRATNIQAGKWEKKSALYLCIKVEMTDMADATKVLFKFHFRPHTRRSRVGSGENLFLPVLHFSPETLLGVAQPVQEESGRDLVVGGEVGKPATASLKTMFTKRESLNRDHQPRLEVRWMNGILEAGLFKTGNKCPTPSSFDLQIVVPNEETRVCIACDVDVDLLYGMSARGAWKEVVVADKSEKPEYDKWAPADWEKKGGCERFQKNATVW